MPPPTRLGLVVAVLVMLVVARALARRWRRGLQHQRRPVPDIPADLVSGAERTWVVFTTPYCASCGPVKERLSASDPGARVVTVDATRHPALANAFDVRSAPTAVLADRAGRAQARLVGAAAVNGWLDEHGGGSADSRAGLERQVRSA